MFVGSLLGGVDRAGLSGKPADRTDVAGATLAGAVRAVVVLLRDESQDLEFLEQAIAAAETENARLLVVVAPQISRWLAACALLPSMAIPEWTSLEQQESEAIRRCTTFALSRIPADLPTTIQVAPGAETEFLGQLGTGFGDQLMIVGRRAVKRWPARWRSLRLDRRAAIAARASRASTV